MSNKLKVSKCKNKKCQRPLRKGLKFCSNAHCEQFAPKKERRRIFTSKEVCTLLIKEMGYSVEEDKTFKVNWKIQKNADDNSIEVTLTN